jgi:serine protease Do
MSPLQYFSDELQSLVSKASPSVVAVTHARGNGTGFVLAPDGYVLTNAHVVAGSGVSAHRFGHTPTTTVRFSDSSEAKATVVGSDAQTDLAVLRVARAELPALPLATEAEVGVGQVVLALGHPFGFERSVSLGVVSALDRRLSSGRGAPLHGLIQTDAAINPGNSGGPLLDVRGRVVGINTAMLPFAQGIGFAMAASTAAWIAPLLIRHGSIRRRFLGIAAKNEAAPAHVAEQLKRARAVRIIEVGPASPAAAGGLQSNDVLDTVSGHPIATIDDLQRALAVETAQSIEVVVQRGSRRIVTQVSPSLRAA